MHKENLNLIFPDGLLGLAEYKEYTFLPLENTPNFFLLQAVENNDFTFFLIDPFIFFNDYKVDLPEKVLEELAIKEEQEVAVYTIVTIPNGDVSAATTNLLGPLVINLTNNKAKQLILDGKKYKTKHILFPKAERKVVNK